MVDEESEVGEQAEEDEEVLRGAGEADEDQLRSIQCRLRRQYRDKKQRQRQQ